MRAPKQGGGTQTVARRRTATTTPDPRLHRPLCLRPTMAASADVMFQIVDAKGCDLDVSTGEGEHQREFVVTLIGRAADSTCYAAEVTGFQPGFFVELDGCTRGAELTRGCATAGAAPAPAFVRKRTGRPGRLGRAGGAPRLRRHVVRRGPPQALPRGFDHFRERDFIHFRFRTRADMRRLVRTARRRRDGRASRSRARRPSTSRTDPLLDLFHRRQRVSAGSSPSAAPGSARRSGNDDVVAVTVPRARRRPADARGSRSSRRSRRSSLTWSATRRTATSRSRARRARPAQIVDPWGPRRAKVGGRAEARGGSRPRRGAPRPRLRPGRP